MILHHNEIVSFVQPSVSSAVAAFAGEELEKYLRQSMGIRLERTDESTERQITICLELLSHDRMLQLTSQAFGPEGFWIRVWENTITIAAPDDMRDCHRGLLYGVYEFLERCLGCCFGAFSDPGLNAGEIVPRYDMLEIADVTYLKSAADLPYRTAIVQYSNWAANADRKLNIPFLDWLSKNRYNRILTWVSIYQQYKELGLLPELAKRGIRLSVGHHESASTWLPHFGNAYFPTRYYEKHPEFYRLQPDGTRFLPKDEQDRSGQWIYCSRNQACIEEVASNLIAWIRDNPMVDVIAFWPNDDSDVQCCCPACSAHSKVENYAYFENEVARRVSASCPHVKIDMLIYQDLWERPAKISFCDNLLMDESTWTPYGLRHCGKPDGSCLIGTDIHRNLLTWKGQNSHAVYYDYYMGVYSNKQCIIPMADELQAIFQTFKEQGIDGSGTQIECFNLWNHLLNFYAFGRTAYDTSLSLTDHIAQLTKLFGEGASCIAQILFLYENTLNGEVPLNEGGRFFLEHIDKELVYHLFEEAFAHAATARIRNNIRLLRMAFRYTDLEVTDPLDRETCPAENAVCYIDPTGELGFMASRFDSFLRNDPGYAITIASTNADNASDDIRDDKWYLFEF